MEWEAWGSCSADCGDGHKQRTRKCTEHGRCDGEIRQVVPCNIQVWVTMVNMVNIARLVWRRVGAIGCPVPSLVAVDFNSVNGYVMGKFARIQRNKLEHVTKRYGIVYGIAYFNNFFSSHVPNPNHHRSFIGVNGPIGFNVQKRVVKAFKFDRGNVNRVDHQNFIYNLNLNLNRFMSGIGTSQWTTPLCSSTMSNMDRLEFMVSLCQLRWRSNAKKNKEMCHWLVSRFSREQPWRCERRLPRWGGQLNTNTLLVCL